MKTYTNLQILLETNFGWNSHIVKNLIYLKNNFYLVNFILLSI